jgi:hypothetical protein
VRQQAPRRGFRTSLTPANKALACGYGGALEGIRTPNLLIRSYLCRRPDPFRSVRDLAGAPFRCSWSSGIPEGRSPRWLPAWLPVAEDLAVRLACCGPYAHIPLSGPSPGSDLFRVRSPPRLGPPASSQVAILAVLSGSSRDNPRSTTSSGTRRARSRLRRPPLRSSELHDLPARTQPLVLWAGGFIPCIFRIMELFRDRAHVAGDDPRPVRAGCCLALGL